MYSSKVDRKIYRQIETYIDEQKDIQMDRKIFRWIERYLNRQKDLYVHRQIERYIDRKKDQCIIKNIVS